MLEHLIPYGHHIYYHNSSEPYFPNSRFAASEYIEEVFRYVINTTLPFTTTNTKLIAAHEILYYIGVTEMKMYKTSKQRSYYN